MTLFPHRENGTSEVDASRSKGTLTVEETARQNWLLFLLMTRGCPSENLLMGSYIDSPADSMLNVQANGPGFGFLALI